MCPFMIEEAVSERGSAFPRAAQPHVANGDRLRAAGLCGPQEDSPHWRHPALLSLQVTRRSSVESLRIRETNCLTCFVFCIL